METNNQTSQAAPQNVSASQPSTSTQPASQPASPSVKRGIFSGMAKPSYLPAGVGDEVLKPASASASASASPLTRPEGPAQSASGAAQSQTQPAKPTADSAQADQGSPASPSQQPLTQPAVQAQPIVPLTPEAMADLLAKVKNADTSQAQQQQSGPTDEEFRKQFNIFQADDATYEAILGVKPDNPERVQALNNALQGVARQAVTVARYLMQQEMAKVSAQINPILQENRASWEKQQEAIFYQKYADLQEYRPLLVEIVEAAKARKMSFPNEQAAMDYLAKTAYALLRRQPGQSAPTTSSQQAAGGTPVAANQMPTLSGGGRSGSGGGVAVAKSAGQRIFGPIPNNFIRK